MHDVLIGRSIARRHSTLGVVSRPRVQSTQVSEQHAKMERPGGVSAVENTTAKLSRTLLHTMLQKAAAWAAVKAWRSDVASLFTGETGAGWWSVA